MGEAGEGGGRCSSRVRTPTPTPTPQSSDPALLEDLLWTQSVAMQKLSFWERTERALLLESVALASPGAYASPARRAAAVWSLRTDSVSQPLFFSASFDPATAAPPSVLPDGGLATQRLADTGPAALLAGLGPITLAPAATSPADLLRIEFGVDSAARVAREAAAVGVDLCVWRALWPVRGKRSSPLLLAFVGRWTVRCSCSF